MIQILSGTVAQLNSALNIGARTDIVVSSRLWFAINKDKLLLCRSASP